MVVIINFIIFLVGGYLNILMYYMFLTPKKGFFRAFMVNFIILSPFAITKFFVEGSSIHDIILQIINNVIIIGLAVLQSKENLLQCLLIWVRVLFLFICSGYIVTITIGYDYDITDIRYTRSYLISLLYVFIVFYFVYKKFKKTSVIVTGRQSVILFVNIGVFVQVSEYLFDKLRALYGYQIGQIHYILGIVFICMPFIIMMINESVVKELMYKHRRKIIDLELEKEREMYENIMKQNEKMAKIRHDIADQIYIAKGIANEEPERAYNILKDLEIKIEEQIG